MALPEIVIIAAVMLTFAFLRFGVPILITWLLSTAITNTARPAVE